MSVTSKVQETNINIYQGTTFRMVLRLSNPETGEAIDYTGSTARGMLRVSYADAAPAGTFTCAFTDAANGVLLVSMTDEQTAALNFNKAFYDIEVEDAGGNVRQVLRGVATLYKEATK